MGNAILKDADQLFEEGKRFHDEKNYKEAFKYNLKAAELNHSKGTLYVGWCYQHSIGVEKDMKKAFEYYQKAAYLGNSEGMFQVGEFYHLGIGVNMNSEKAFEYFVKSAEKNNSMGIHAIYYLYKMVIKKNKYSFRLDLRHWNYHYHEFEIYPNGEKNYQNAFTIYLKTKNDYEMHQLNQLRIKQTKNIELISTTKNNNINKMFQFRTEYPNVRWTTKNKDVDDYIKMFQFRTIKHEVKFDWIPFDRLTDIKKIGEGGFSTVFSAILNKQKILVALKTLSASNKPSDFFKEIEVYLNCET